MMMMPLLCYTIDGVVVVQARRRLARASPRVTLNPKPSACPFWKYFESAFETTTHKKEKRRHEPLFDIE